MKLEDVGEQSDEKICTEDKRKQQENWGAGDCIRSSFIPTLHQ
jgi:hypothetical protein